MIMQLVSRRSGDNTPRPVGFGSVYSAPDLASARTSLSATATTAWAVNYEVEPPGRAPEEGVQEKKKKGRSYSTLLVSMEHK